MLCICRPDQPPPVERLRSNPPRHEWGATTSYRGSGIHPWWLLEAKVGHTSELAQQRLERFLVHVPVKNQREDSTFSRLSVSLSPSPPHTSVSPRGSLGSWCWIPRTQKKTCVYGRCLGSCVQPHHFYLFRLPMITLVFVAAGASLPSPGAIVDPALLDIAHAIVVATAPAKSASKKSIIFFFFRRHPPHTRSSHEAPA